MLSDRELKLFEKFLHGAFVEDEEAEEIYEMASTGLIRIGFSESPQPEREYQETARLTPLGINMLKRERILRSPVKRFFYRLVNV